jgi:hypothetical protein
MSNPFLIFVGKAIATFFIACVVSLMVILFASLTTKVGEKIGLFETREELFAELKSVVSEAFEDRCGQVVFVEDPE